MGFEPGLCADLGVLSPSFLGQGGRQNAAHIKITGDELVLLSRHFLGE